ncbi:hypothetical protein BDV95DRAFT_604690 [Massariosphaeria phaeospora]|uniref:Uncharacterized protein n=1 Tax=Massariosphaeria phaeospora TaxID=100035 RepID=A0A7C8IA75_9PLEO|nr:hypothetical protein BDV95DRAFT_604690 [Massariosphaeria phaeospora]
MPSTGLLASNEFAGDYQDAGRAAEQDLISPLTRLQQRADSYSSQITSTLSEHRPRPASVVPSVFQYEDAGFGTPIARPRGRSGSSDLRDGSGSGPHVRARGGRHFQERQAYSPAYHNTEAPYPRGRSRRRGETRARTAQRSSENLPVGGSDYEDGYMMPHPQTQSHRPSYGRGRYTPSSSGRGGNTPSQIAPMRSSMLPTPSPRDMSNRHHTRALPQPSASTWSPRDLDRIDHPRTFTPPAHSYRPGSQRRYMQPPPHSYRGQPHSHRGRRDGSGALTAIQVPPERAPPFTSPTLAVARGTMSWRPHTARASTFRRRLPSHQHDQENSGDAEAELMREELAALSMRYADDQPLETMDETPPRTGRFEQHTRDRA